jgi:uncharacterized protein YjdB
MVTLRDKITVFSLRTSGIRSLTICVTFLVIATTCGGSASPTSPTFGGQNVSANITVTNLSVSAAATSLAVSQLTTVTATATYSDGTTAAVTPTWSSSDTAVATIGIARHHI